MSTSRFVAILALVTGAAGFGTALGQAKPQDKPQEKPKATAQEAGAKKEMMAAPKPGPEHKVLESKVGKWNGKVKMWMTPDATSAEESTCTAEYKWVMNGLYLHDETKGTFGGMPFEGMGLTTYDTIKKKYVSTWADNMCSGIMTSEGTYDPASKSFAYAGQAPCPGTGKYEATKMTEKEIDANSWMMEMQATDPKSGKMFKCMEITYTRAK